jgi:hypothetical protein
MMQELTEVTKQSLIDVGIRPERLEIYRGVGPGQELHIAMQFPVPRDGGFHAAAQVGELVARIQKDVLESAMVQSRLKFLEEQNKKLNEENKQLQQYKVHYDMSYKLNHGVDPESAKPWEF